MRALALSALVAALGIALGTACAGKPIDPLARDRARLAALADEPLDENWTAQAAIYVGPSLLKQQIDAVLVDVRDTATNGAPVETPLGALRAVPRAQADTVTLAPSTACPACVEVRAAASGLVDVDFQSPFGSVQRSVPFELAATATLELALVSEGNERSVHLRAVQDGAWDVEVSAPGMPPDLAVALSGVLGTHLEGAVRGGLVPELPLFRLTSDDELPLRGVRARPVPDGNGGYLVAVELAFVVLESAAPGRAPDPGDGFVVVVPEKTLLGIVRAGALRAPAEEGFAPEPTSFDVDGEQFTLDLRIWKIAPEPTADTFRVLGRTTVERGDVRVKADRVELVESAFDLNPTRLIERMAIIATLQNELNAAIPARVEEDVALKRRVEVEVLSAEGKRDALEIRGRVRLLAPEG